MTLLMLHHFIDYFMSAPLPSFVDFFGSLDGDCFRC
jgi:hypothetical protein